MVAYICSGIGLASGLILLFNSEGLLFVSAILIVSASILNILGVYFSKK